MSASPDPDLSNIDAILAGGDFPVEEGAAIDGLRKQNAIDAAKATAEELKRTIRSTRDRAGRIRQAKFTAAVLALRLEGFTKASEIAKILGCSVQQVSGALHRVRKDATIDQQLDRLDQIAVPLAVDNVIEGIANKDKTYTLRLMDGRGLFRVHKSIDAQVKQTVITMRVNMTIPKHLAPGSPLPTVKAGTVVGAPETGEKPAPLPAAPAKEVTVETPSGHTIAVLASPDV